MTRTKKLTRMLLALLLLAGITIAVSADGFTDVTKTYVSDDCSYTFSGSLYVNGNFTINAYTGINTTNGNRCSLSAGFEIYDADGNRIGCEDAHEDGTNLFVYASDNGSGTPAVAYGYHDASVYYYEVIVEENTGIATTSPYPTVICSFNERTTWEP